MRIDAASKSKTQKPKNFSEKMSRKNPPKKALITPHHEWWGVKRLIKTTAIKTRFSQCPKGK